MTRRRVRRSPTHLFDSLARAMIKRDVLTAEEVGQFLQVARQDGTTGDIYEMALSNMIRLCNQRLRDRGRKYRDTGVNLHGK